MAIWGAMLGTAIWIAEGFGAIFTGRGTDPNGGLLLILLLILLGACYWTRGTPPELVTSTGRSGTDPRRLVREFPS